MFNLNFKNGIQFLDINFGNEISWKNQNLKVNVNDSKTKSSKRISTTYFTRKIENITLK